MSKTIVIVGGGVAGLMAAETCLKAGARAILVDHMPTLGRKFLMAGKSGLNLTFDEPIADFVARYDHPRMAEIVEVFPPYAVRDWADGLGARSFIGSAGKVFPQAMKASPLLRAWIEQLVNHGLEFHTRWRWVGRDPSDLMFETENGLRSLAADAVIFALGGGSWARLGSDGAWLDRFPTRQFRHANIGFDCDWSVHVRAHAGEVVKNAALTSDHKTIGEFVITKTGVEGGGIYHHAPAILDGASLAVDLLPHQTERDIKKRLSKTGKASIGNRLRKLGLSPTARALYFECRTGDEIAEVKHLHLPITNPRPIDEGISTAGGVLWRALDDGLMLRDYPNVYCAGEMVEWDAPTGGYLINGCLAMGRWAGHHASQ